MEWDDERIGKSGIQVGMDVMVGLRATSMTLLYNLYKRRECVWKMNRCKNS